MNVGPPGWPWGTMPEPFAAEAGARRRAMAWRMLSGSVKKIATRSRIWNRLRSSSGEPELERSLSLTPQGIIGMGSRLPSLLAIQTKGPLPFWGGGAIGAGGARVELHAVGRLSRCRSRGVAWTNTRPCQGRERRFESGRDRQLSSRRTGSNSWSGAGTAGRVVEGGGLGNRYGSLAHREFESLPLRQAF